MNGIQFSWWLLVAFVFAALAVVIGFCQYKLDDDYVVGRNGRIIFIVRRRFKDPILYWSAILMAVIVTLMIVYERITGILQLALDSLNGVDNPIYAYIIGVPLIVVTLGLLYGFLLFLLMKLAGYISHERLENISLEREEDIKEMLKTGIDRSGNAREYVKKHTSRT
ncbi:hypothetical protein IKG33_02850 [Candidatus Saccharibacteria bacterium]|nr:hypothetical protein [Candidatus Saccharibacteria bacterium]